MRNLFKQLLISSVSGMGFALGAAIVIAIVVWLGFVLVTFCDDQATGVVGASSSGGKFHQPTTSPDIERVSVYVHYESTALVVASENAVAAFAFGSVIPEGVSYEYRYLNRAAKSERRGNGTVFENYKSIPGENPNETRLDDQGGQLLLEAGSISVEWSQRSVNAGWVYYAPRQYRIFSIPARDFNSIDLRSFVP